MHRTSIKAKNEKIFRNHKNPDFQMTSIHMETTKWFLNSILKVLKDNLKICTYLPIRTACMWSKLMNICIVITKMDNNAIQTYWSLDWLKQKP